MKDKEKKRIKDLKKKNGKLKQETKKAEIMLEELEECFSELSCHYDWRLGDIEHLQKRIVMLEGILQANHLEIPKPPRDEELPFD